jgi:hypothetical protein
MPQFVLGSISGVRGSGGSYPRFSVPFGGEGRGVTLDHLLCGSPLYSPEAKSKVPHWGIKSTLT